MERRANLLVNEKSPYLIQHAYNPVDWFPWSQEAFEKAKAEDRPIFLSIGYSTCHWCHVMEKESFEDSEVAGLLNRKYVSIKVDREERPDLDNVYMSVCQLMTGAGGWPLTIIMAPDRRPFFAATYLPKESKRALRSIHHNLPRLHSLFGFFLHKNQPTTPETQVGAVTRVRPLETCSFVSAGQTRPHFCLHSLKINTGNECEPHIFAHSQFSN